MRTSQMMIGVGLIAAATISKSAAAPPQSTQTAQHSSPADTTCDTRRDLIEVARCFHLRAGPTEQHRLLIKEGRAQMNLQDWKRGPLPKDSMTHDGTLTGSSCTPKGVTVLDQATQAQLRGRLQMLTQAQQEDLAMVQLQQECSKQQRQCVMTTTQTWSKHEREWRRVLLPQTARAVGAHWNEGRYAQISPAADAWLEQDPLSMPALRLKGWALMRGVGDPSPADKQALTSKMQSINPADSQTHLIAASLAPDFKTARAVLSKMEANDCMRPLVLQNTALRADSPQIALTLLEQEDPDRKLATIQLTFNMDAGRHATAREVLKSPAMKRWRAIMESEDPSFVVWWATKIGTIAHELGEDDLALDWVSLALSKDPKHPAAMQLSDALKQRK